MHLNDEQIQRYLHGELSSGERADVASHVSECELCAGRVAEAEQEERDVFDRLGALDHPVPHHDVNAVMQARVENERAPSTVPHVWLRRAAVIVMIAVLGGAAYAIPGSPLPAWIDKIATALQDGGKAPVEQDRVNVDTVDTTTLVPAVSGVAIPPSRNFAIVLAAPQDSGVVYLTPTDGFNVVIRAIGGAPRYTLASSDRLDVDNTGLDSSYEIEVPMTAPYVELMIGDRRVVLKDRVRFGENLPSDEKGRYVISLRPLQ